MSSDGIFYFSALYSRIFNGYKTVIMTPAVDSVVETSQMSNVDTVSGSHVTVSVNIYALKARNSK